MKPPKCRFCSVMEWRHVCSNDSRASNATASNAITEGDRYGDRSGETGRRGRVRSKPIQGSAQAVAKVERNGPEGVQRDIQRDVAKPAIVPAPTPRQTKPSDVANNVLERGVDSGWGGVKQRWSRRAYNSYQRFYMQSMRAIKSGRAEPWPTM